MERLTEFVTPVGMVKTNLNSMKHYMPCVPCRHNAKIKYDSNGNGYTEKFGFCDTCEVKMLFDKLKEYEDLEEQGLLLRLPYKVGDTVYIMGDKFPAIIESIRITEDNHIMFEFVEYDKSCEITEVWDEGGFEIEDIGKTVFLTEEEAKARLKELEGSEDK